MLATNERAYCAGADISLRKEYGGWCSLDGGEPHNKSKKCLETCACCQSAFLCSLPAAVLSKQLEIFYLLEVFAHCVASDTRVCLVMAFVQQQLPSMMFARSWITTVLLLWSMVFVVVTAWEPLVRSYVPPADRACHPLTDGAARCGLSITAYKLASSSSRLSNRNPWCSSFVTLAGKYHYLFVAGEPGTTASNLYPFNPSSSIAAGAPTVGWPVTLPLQHILTPIQACQAFNVDGVGFSLAGSIPAGGNEGRSGGGGATIITAQVNNTAINNNNVTPGEWHKQQQIPPPSSLPLSLSTGTAAAAPAITPSDIPVNVPSSSGNTPPSLPSGDSAVLILAAPGSYAHAVRISFDINSHSLFVATPQRLSEQHLNDFSILRTGRFGTLVAFSRHLGTNECSTPVRNSAQEC